jgi:hypothetical protein
MLIKVKRTPAVVAVFDDDDNLKQAIVAANKQGLKPLDCFTPFPVHGIEKLLGIKRSNLAVAAFVFGCIGFSFAMYLMTYTMRIDWPEIIGGKPNWPLTSFIPILFELSVLIASLGMAFTYFWINGMFPGVEPVLYDLRATDDRFVILYPKGTGNGDDIRKLMADNGAVELRDDDYITHNFPGPSPIRLRKVK